MTLAEQKSNFATDTIFINCFTQENTVTQARTALVVGREDFSNGVLASAQFPLLYIHETWVFGESLDFTALSLSGTEIKRFQAIGRAGNPGLYLLLPESSSIRYFYFISVPDRASHWTYEMGAHIELDSDGVVCGARASHRGTVILGQNALTNLYSHLSCPR